MAKILILQFLDNGVGDAVIKRGDLAMEQKGTNAGHEVKTLKWLEFDNPNVNDIRNSARVIDIKEWLNKLNPATDKIILSGHGSIQQQTLADWSADTIATSLAAWGLKSGLLISVVSCYLGGDGRFMSPATVMAMDTFGSRLHYALGAEHKVFVRVHARVFPTTILDLVPDPITGVSSAEAVAQAWSTPNFVFDPAVMVGRKTLSVVAVTSGQKVPFVPSPLVKYSKIGFAWKGNEQVRYWVMKNKGLPGIDYLFGQEWDLLDRIPKERRPAILRPLTRSSLAQPAQEKPYIGGAYYSNPWSKGDNQY